MNGLRFAGGGIFEPLAFCADNAAQVLDAWGGKVWMVADRQAEIEAMPDKLDAALDKLGVVQVGEDWKATNPRYILIQTGYQGVEPPRPRKGLRDASSRHIYAAGLLGLAQWVSADAAGNEPVFWKSTWNNLSYTAVAVASVVAVSAEQAVK